jgi:sugar phosphate permease
LFPTRWPFYYGWVIVAVAFVGAGLASGVSLWGASVFVIPMTDELGWSRATFFLAFTVRGAVIGLVSPLIGQVFDSRHGPRLAMIGGGVLLAGSMVLMRSVDSLWQFILLFGVAGGLADIGSGFTISQTLVPKWFVLKRGRALGVAIAGVGLGATVFPVAVSSLVDAVGWRDAWVWFGLVAGGLTVLLGLFVRTRPEDVGLLPDGVRDTQGLPFGGAHGASAAAMADEVSLTRGEALRTPTFWLLLLSFTLVGFGIMGFQANWLPFLQERGFSKSEAAFGIAFYGVVSGLSRPLWGLVGERVPARLLMSGSTMFTGVSILVFLQIETLPLVVVYMSVAGVAMGGFLILQSLLTANYFGRAHLGSITVMTRPAMMISSALSPLIVGLFYDINGNYDYAFMFTAVAWFAAGIVVIMAKPPVKAAGAGERE